MAVVAVGPLPESALAAAASFHADVLPRVRAVLAEGADQLILAFAPADHRHRAWRLAAVQGLAREHAPVRVNALESADAQAIAAVETYLASAPGVTGHYLPLDAAGATSAL